MNEALKALWEQRTSLRDLLTQHPLPTLSAIIEALGGEESLLIPINHIEQALQKAKVNRAKDDRVHDQNTPMQGSGRSRKLGNKEKATARQQSGGRD